jgi:hypothetical protein
MSAVEAIQNRYRNQLRDLRDCIVDREKRLTEALWNMDESEHKRLAGEIAQLKSQYLFSFLAFRIAGGR